MNIINDQLHDEVSKCLNNLEHSNLLEIQELIENSFIERASNKIDRLIHVFFEKYYGSSSIFCI